MEGAIRGREGALLPVYRQVATAFAQMHDSPVRMVAKGVLRGIVPWAQARPFLAARLRRRSVRHSADLACYMKFMKEPQNKNCLYFFDVICMMWCM